MTHHDDDRYHHDHDHHTCSWQTCAKKSEGLGRVGFYFSKFEAPLDYCPLISLLTLSSKDNIFRRPRHLKIPHQAVINTPHFCPYNSPCKLLDEIGGFGEWTEEISCGIFKLYLKSF